MNYSMLRKFSQNEKVALLKLLIQIAYSDGEWSQEEKSAIKDYLMQNDLKCNGSFTSAALKEALDGIVREFESCKNLSKCKKLSMDFAKEHGIAPDFERVLLNAIECAGQNIKKKITLNIKICIRTSLAAFGKQLGREEIRPDAKPRYRVSGKLLPTDPLFGGLQQIFQFADEKAAGQQRAGQ
jgi:hypothetical protein